MPLASVALAMMPPPLVKPAALNGGDVRPRLGAALPQLLKPPKLLECCMRGISGQRDPSAPGP